MIDRTRRCVEAYLGDVERRDVDAGRFFCLDDSKGPSRGCILLVFEERSDSPLLVAKGAPRRRALSREGRSVYEIEFENLERLEGAGMNREGRTTPAPLRMWSDDEIVVTLQSALPGRLMKNVPGRQLFSAERLPATTEMVFSWWRRFQERCGTERRPVTEQTYRDEILAPVDLFRRRFVLGAEERRFLERRFEQERRLLGAELPFLATHGDFCPANVMEHAGRAAVFDWEFPLRPRLPLFDVFHFFSSTRFPFRGARGESSHFESFKAVFWGGSYFTEIVRATLRRICEEHRIAEEWVPDLFLLSLVHIANLKFEGLVEVHGVDGERLSERQHSLWQSLGWTDKDVPFACIREGVFENLRFLVENGFPSWLGGAEGRSHSPPASR